MRAARKPVKRALPYSTYTSTVLPAAYAVEQQRHEEWKKKRTDRNPLKRMMGRIASAIVDTFRGRAGPPPLQAGDILRDFPFYTQVSEVCYFSTHPSLCGDVFGVHHGEKLRFGAGLWAGRTAVVIGVRGGRLWIVLSGESTARVLPVPDAAAVLVEAEEDGDGDASSSGMVKGMNVDSESCSVWGILRRYYQFTKCVTSESDTAGGKKKKKKTMDNHGSSSAPGVGSESGISQSHHHQITKQLHPYRNDEEKGEDVEEGDEEDPLHVLSDEFLAQVQEAARRMYSTEQISFLQRAPDLFAAIVDTTVAAAADVYRGEDAVDDDGVNGGNKRLVGGSDDEEEGSWSIGKGHAQDSGQWPLSPLLSTSQRASSPSMYDAIAADVKGEKKLILLTPRIVLATGTVGWAGEGNVMVNSGGVEHFRASLSASVVL